MIAKLAILGDGGVGKTTFVKRHQMGEFESKYIPTLGVQVSQLTFQTTRGTILYNIWDAAGQERFGGLREGYFIGSNCAILMFDVLSPSSYRNIPSWYHDITKVCPQIPIVLVGNKIDAKDRKLSSKRITFHKKNKLRYFEISSKSNYHFEMPFLSLARALTNDPNLQFTTAKVPMPPSVVLDPVLVDKYDHELSQADLIPLPHEDAGDRKSVV